MSLGALFISLLISLGVLAARMAHPEAPPQVAQLDWISVGNVKIGMGVLIDNLSAMMLLVVTFIGFLIQVYSTGYMESEQDFGFAKFFAYLSLFTSSMLGLVLATNFVQIYVFWELVGLSSYLLIGFWYHKPSAADACKKAFVVTRFGDLGFLLGILVIFNTVGTLAFVGADNALSSMAGLAATNPTLLTIVCVLIFCGAVGKSAQFPLHIWLPDAMEGPTPSVPSSTRPPWWLPASTWWPGASSCSRPARMACWWWPTSAASRPSSPPPWAWCRTTSSASWPTPP